MEKRGQNIERNWCHPRLNFLEENRVRKLIEYTGTWLILDTGQEVVLGGKTSRKCGITFLRLRGFTFRKNESAYDKFSNVFFSRTKRPAGESYSAFSTHFHA